MTGENPPIKHLTELSFSRYNYQLSESRCRRIRPDLEEVLKLHSYGLDENRPQAVERRRTASAIHGIEQRTARANVENLCDDGSWIEYGALVIAGQRRRRGLQDLRENTPADGMLCGLGTVNAETFGPEAARCMILAYDYTVLAGADNASFEPFWYQQRSIFREDRLGDKHRKC